MQDKTPIQFSWRVLLRIGTASEGTGCLSMPIHRAGSGTSWWVSSQLAVGSRVSNIGLAILSHTTSAWLKGSSTPRLQESGSEVTLNCVDCIFERGRKEVWCRPYREGPCSKQTRIFSSLADTAALLVTAHRYTSLLKVRYLLSWLTHRPKYEEWLI